MDVLIDILTDRAVLSFAVNTAYLWRPLPRPVPSPVAAGCRSHASLAAEERAAHEQAAMKKHNNGVTASALTIRLSCASQQKLRAQHIAK